MKAKMILLAAWCLAGYVSGAQSGKEISIPATPAFSILGYEPASVMRPTNPKELSANLLNSFDPNGKLLMNVGIEVGPYWLKNRPFLTREQYLQPKGWQAFKQTLMISAATVKDSASGNNKLGTGFRFKLAGGELSPEFKMKESLLVSRASVIAAVNSARAFLEIPDESLKLKTKQEIADFIVEVLDDPESNLGAFVSEFKSLASDSAKYQNTPQDLGRYITSINEKLTEATLPLQRDIAALSKKRIGLIAEVAGASSFYTGEHDKFEKAGVWLNVSNVKSITDAWSFTGRYFFSNKDTLNTNLDAGVAYIKELNEFSISIEVLGRSYRAEYADVNINNVPITRVEKDITYRLAAQASYRLAPGISVNLSLGKNFDAPFIHKSGFFSIFGINYDIFNKAIVQMPQSQGNSQ